MAYKEDLALKTNYKEVCIAIATKGKEIMMVINSFRCK